MRGEGGGEGGWAKGPGEGKGMRGERGRGRFSPVLPPFFLLRASRDGEGAGNVEGAVLPFCLLMFFNPTRPLILFGLLFF